MSRFTRALLPVVLAGALLAPDAVGATGLKHTARLRITPNPAILGRPFHVRITGLSPREHVSFLAVPSLEGFGPSTMGARISGPRGVIAFTFHAFRKRWQLGRWRIVAVAHKRQIAAAMVVVRRPVKKHASKKKHRA